MSSLCCHSSTVSEFYAAAAAALPGCDADVCILMLLLYLECLSKFMLMSAMFFAIRRNWDCEDFAASTAWLTITLLVAS